MAKTLTLTRTASVTLTSWPTTTGGATAPSQFTILNSVVIPAGTYTVNWSVTLSGTTGANEVNNFLLVLPGLPGITSVNGSAAGTYPQAPVTFTTSGGPAFLQTGPNNGTAGAVYSETLNGGGGSGTVQLGPTSPGELWHPSQVSVSCSAAVSTGTCQCSIYAGSAPSQSTFVDGTFSGDTGDTSDAIGGHVINPGQSIFVAWTGGPPGATATAVVAGQRTVPLWGSLTR